MELNKDLDKLIAEFLTARRAWVVKWQEIWEEHGEKNVSTINILVQDTNEADELYIAEMKLKDYWFRQTPIPTPVAPSGPLKEPLVFPFSQEQASQLGQEQDQDPSVSDS
tara:strand:+ start:1644 stop:1973 length:330 start_codon:yes stop_codon:yes gene_type:complete